jgi:hypothetical protein
MERLFFADSWREYFADHGLRTFRQFFDETSGVAVNKNARRDVARLTLGDAPPKVFFLKRSHEPHLKDILAGLRTFGRLTSVAGVEWRNANHLLQNGIGTYRPVCCGEETLCGIERRSFLITEQLEATCLMDFVLDRWQGLDRAEQRSMVVDMAGFARRIHALDIALPDLSVWHIFLSPSASNGKHELSIIDLQRMIWNARGPFHKTRDLAKLHWSMSDRYFDKELKDLLVSTYAEAAGVDRDTLTKAVTARVRKLDGVHPPDRYYRHTASKRD